MNDDTINEPDKTDEPSEKKAESFQPNELSETSETPETSDTNSSSEDDSADDREFEDNYQPSNLAEAFHIPVKISAILGRRKMPVSELINLKENDVIKLDRNVGEAIDILVNDRLIARGEVVIMEDRLGITMTEIIKKSDF